MTPWLVLPGWGFDAAALAPLLAALGGVPGPAVDPPRRAATLEDWAVEAARQVPAAALALGWSFGAQCALALAAAGAPLRGLVLLAASPRFVAHPGWPHGLDGESVSRFEHGIRRDPARTLARFLALQAVGDARRAAVLDRLRPHLAAPAACDLAHTLDLLLTTDLRDLLPQVRCPVLLVHGEGDALMPADAARALAAALPDARLVLLPDCGHAPHVSAPEPVRQQIRQFLTGIGE